MAETLASPRTVTLPAEPAAGVGDTTGTTEFKAINTLPRNPDAATPETDNTWLEETETVPGETVAETPETEKT